MARTLQWIWKETIIFSCWSTINQNDYPFNQQALTDSIRKILWQDFQNFEQWRIVTRFYKKWFYEETSSLYCCTIRVNDTEHWRTTSRLLVLQYDTQWNIAYWSYANPQNESIARNIIQACQDAYHWFVFYQEYWDYILQLYKYDITPVIGPTWTRNQLDSSSQQCQYIQNTVIPDLQNQWYNNVYISWSYHISKLLNDAYYIQAMDPNWMTIAIICWFISGSYSWKYIDSQNAWDVQYLFSTSTDVSQVRVWWTPWDQYLDNVFNNLS